MGLYDNSGQPSGDGLYDNSGQPSGDDLFGDGFFEGAENPGSGRSYVTKAGDYSARLMELKTGTSKRGTKYVSLLWMTDCEGEWVSHRINTRSADPLKNRSLGSQAAEILAQYNWTPEAFRNIVLSGRAPVLDAIISVEISDFGGRGFAEVTRVKPVALQPATVASATSASDDGLPY